MRQAVKLVILLVLLVTAALYVRLNPPERIELGGGSLAELPTTLGRWESVELRFEDVVYEELDADDTLARRYSGPGGRSIWFVIIFHQNERYGAHDPLVCYRSQGWSIEQDGVVELGSGADAFTANWIRAQAPGQDRAAIYWWYTAGDLATSDRDEFMSRMATAGIRSNVTFGAFIRVSTTVTAGDVDEALAVLTTFAEEAIPHVRALFSEPAGDGAP